MLISGYYFCLFMGKIEYFDFVYLHECVYLFIYCFSVFLQSYVFCLDVIFVSPGLRGITLLCFCLFVCFVVLFCFSVLF